MHHGISRNRVERHKRARNRFTKPRHAINERLLVHRQCKRSTHSRISKRIRSAARAHRATVETKEISAKRAESAHIAAFAFGWRRQHSNDIIDIASARKACFDVARIVLEVHTTLSEHLGLVLRSKIREPIGATRLEAQHACVWILNRAALNALSDDGVAIPIVRIRHQTHVALVAPHSWNIRAVGDDLAGLRPIVALHDASRCGFKRYELLNRCSVHGRECWKRAEIEKVRERFFERDDEGLRIGCRDANTRFEISSGRLP